MTAETIRVADQDSRATIAEHIGKVNARAKRVPCVVGNETIPTEWDRRHQQINLLLDELEGWP